MRKEETIRRIGQETVKRYSDRLRKFGLDPRTLGWDTRINQITRFEAVLQTVGSLDGKSILDIGCGFGDLLLFLLIKGVNFRRYIGLDINPDLVEVAKTTVGEDPRVEFRVGDVFSMKEKPIADVGVMLGLLNFNLSGKLDNYEYAEKAIRSAFSLVREALVVDFLSARRYEGYPAEEFVFYYDPAKVLSMALSLSENVVLNHSYPPIPQKEFLVVIRKRG